MQIITNQSQKELKKHGSDQFPLLVSYERLSRYEAGSFLWHWHPEIEITYVQKGKMTYKVNHNTYHLQEGNFLFGNAGVLHAGYMENMQDCEYVSVTFSPKLLYGFPGSSVWANYVEPLTQDFSLSAILIDFSRPWHEDFTALVLQIIEIERDRPAFYEIDIITRLLALWKSLLQNYTPTGGCTAHDKLDFDRIKKMVGFLEENYMHKISLRDISDHVHLCESECCRLFKRYMNVSLFSFLQEYRIERSLEYFPTDASLTDISGRVGFSDSNYYAKVFRKLKGCSPKKYRQRLK